MRNPSYPRSPGKALTTAFQMAMSATLALAKDRATGEAHPLYHGQGNRIKGMAKIWREAKDEYKETVTNGVPDAWKLLKVEKDIRRNFFRIMLKTSIKYGNRETKRIKRSEGNQEYLNQLWDYSGSRIRDVMKERFEFPRPGIITLGNGKLGVGYPGSAKTPIYPLRHNHLPELDFGDMVRSHLVELVRQCLKYGVPRRKAMKYVDELVARLLPFMDYVYTERNTGRSNFIRGGIQELRAVVDQIRSQFGTRNGRPQSMTSVIAASLEEHTSKNGGSLAEPEEIEEAAEEWVLLDDPHYSFSAPVDESETAAEDYVTNLFDRMIARTKKEGIIEWGDSIEQVKSLIMNGTLTEDDARELLRKTTEESRRVGIRFHRFISRYFPSPFKLSATVYHGDEMTYDKSGMLLISELYVASGRGRADLVLMRRKSLSRVDDSSPIVAYEPCMVVDLKTRSSFDVDIYGVKTKSKSEENTVNEFVLERRRMSEDNWTKVIASPVSEADKAQLQAYSDAILSEYSSVMRRDTLAPTDLLKAVIVVDSKEDWGEMRGAILPLVLEAYQRASNNDLTMGEVLRPSEKGHPLRMALKVLSKTISASEVQPIDYVEQFDPFKNRVNDEKEFILYLSVSGRGSPSQSASVIAARWHGLQYIHSLARNRARDVIWFDLTGEYGDPVLAQQRLRLSRHSASVKRFYRSRVQMIDLSSVVRAYLHEGATLKELKVKVEPVLKNSRKPVIVVTGWDFLRRGTPDPLLGALNEFARLLISEAPVGCKMVWFTRPVPLAQNNALYDTRCVAPFYRNTHWERYVDEIVWNMPMPPRRLGALASANYHIRVLVVERHDGKTPKTELIHMDVLKGWGEDFRSGGRRLHRETYSIGPAASSVKYARTYTDGDIRNAMTLVPHFWPQQSSEEEWLGERYEIESVHLDDEQVEDIGLPDRLRFKFYQYKDRIESDGRIKRLLPMEKIDRRREYRTMKLGVKAPGRSTKPPSEALLSVRHVNNRSIAWMEIRALSDTIGFLQRTQKSSDEWKDLLQRIGDALEIEEEKVSTIGSDELMNRLRLVRQTLETSDLSKTLWKRLWPVRSKTPTSLDSDQRGHIERIKAAHPDLLLITGNHLFILILAALGVGQSVVHTDSLESLWSYVAPWHLMGLGFRVSYPKSHLTGNSVLDRQKLLPRLRQRAAQLNAMLETMNSVSDVRFGQLIVPTTSGDASSVMLWLVFQRRPGGQEMNAALLTSRGVDSALPPPALLKALVSEKTYWSESDISRLSKHAAVARRTTGIPIMIARHRDLQAIWILDGERGIWSPVGRMDYTTRRVEDVTLVRTITMREEPLLEAIPIHDVRRLPSYLKDPIDVAMLIMNRGLEGCGSVRCHVSLDHDESMYSIIFAGSDDQPVEDGQRPLRLLVNRTEDLLELLRRPDYECEPVVVESERLIWNRFRDIEYTSDVAVIRPWVERKNPFGKLAFALPPTADDLMLAERDVDLELEVYHDPWTCPLRYISLEDIRRERKRTSHVDSDYLFRFVPPLGQPERLANESGMSHGSCWGFRIYSRQSIPPEVLELQEIRMTDSLAMSLASARELVYWSEERGSWVTHSFDLILKKEMYAELQESWHLRKLLHGDKKLIIPGTYLDAEDNWDPSFMIEPNKVTIGLCLRGVGEERTLKLKKRGLALGDPDDAREFMRKGMERLLKRYSMTPDRKLTAAIRGKIEDALEGARVSEERADLTFERVIVSRASFGGEQLRVVLSSTHGNEYEYPVLTWVHKMQEWGRLSRNDISEMVRSDLSELKLDESMLKDIIKRCVQALRYHDIRVS